MRGLSGHMGMRVSRLYSLSIHTERPGSALTEGNRPHDGQKANHATTQHSRFTLPRHGEQHDTPFLNQHNRAVASRRIAMWISLILGGTRQAHSLTPGSINRCVNTRSWRVSLTRIQVGLKMVYALVHNNQSPLHNLLHGGSRLHVRRDHRHHGDSGIAALLVPGSKSRSTIFCHHRAGMCVAC